MNNPRGRCVWAWVLVPLLHVTVQAGPVPPAISDDQFTFVVLGDRSRHHPEPYERMIAAVVQLSPSFAVQVGDIIDFRTGDVDQIEADRERWYPQIHPLETPYYGVFSHHELQALGKPGLNAYRRYRNRALHHAFDYRDAHFAFLNTDDVAGLEPEGEQLGWLKEDLAEADTALLFVFMHRPAASRRGQEELQRLLAQRSVDAVFIGHDLSGQAFEPDEGIPYVNLREMRAPDGSSAPIVVSVAVHGDRFRMAVIDARAVEQVAVGEVGQRTNRRGVASKRRRAEFERRRSAFESPRIVAIISAPGAETRYGIDKGMEASINRQDFLQVYRAAEKEGDSSQRRLIGWLKIELSGVDAGALGTFIPASGQAGGEWELPAEGDIVAPVLVVPTESLFEEGAADLKPGGVEELTKLAGFVSNFSPGRLVAACHAHSEGTADANLRLSEDRANAVSVYLAGTFDFIPPDLIEPHGYGDAGHDFPSTAVGSGAGSRIEFTVWGK